MSKNQSLSWTNDDTVMSIGYIENKFVITMVNYKTNTCNTMWLWLPEAMALSESIDEQIKIILPEEYKAPPF
jgi:hypothetical protein